VRGGFSLRGQTSLSLLQLFQLRFSLVSFSFKHFANAVDLRCGGSLIQLQAVHLAAEIALLRLQLQQSLLQVATQLAELFNCSVAASKLFGHNVQLAFRGVRVFLGGGQLHHHRIQTGFGGLQ